MLSAILLAGAMIFVTPYQHEAPLIRAMQTNDHAGGRLDLNVYELTDHHLEQALLDQAAAGVHVRILLAGHPYRGGYIVREERTFCSRSPLITCRNAPSRFTYDHAKYAVFGDQDVCLGTANWTYDAFHRNREYIYCTQNDAVVRAAEQVFQSDWTGVPAGRGPRGALVLSPGASGVFESLLGRPGPLRIEAEEMGYLRGIDRLIESHGSVAKIILPSSARGRDNSALSRLIAHGVQVRYLSHPYMHAKLILCGNLAFVGSQNFSWTSLHKNREVGVLIRDPNMIDGLARQFTSDWSKAVSP